MLKRLRQALATPHFDDENETISACFLNTIALASLPLMLASAAYYWLTDAPQLGLHLAVLGALTLASLTALPLIHQGHVQAASLMFCSVMWVSVILLSYTNGGVGSAAYPTSMLITLVVGLLMGGHAAIGAAGLCILAGLHLGYAEICGLLPPSHPLPMEAWLHRSTDLIAIAVLLFLADRVMHERLQRVRHHEQALTQANQYLETSRAVLRLRTKSLARRTRYLQTTAEVIRDVASVLNLRELLTKVVTLVSMRFHLYHAAIYLLDDSGEWAVLQAASSEGGKRMLARGHRVKVGQAGIVGYVASTEKPYVVPDVEKNPVFSENQDLHDTHSEIALPLHARGEMMGVLDVHSTDTKALHTEDVAVLQTLADSVAVAIQQARLFQSVTQQRERLRALAMQLAEAQESERRRLARDLHDLVGQNLNALGINLNLIRTHLPETTMDPAGSQLGESLALLEETSASIRRVMDDLRPPMLDDFGLLATLHWYGERFASRTGIAVTVQAEEPIPRLPERTENALFRIVQEGLTNVTKHAQATKVAVTMAADEQTVRLVIADDGVGFDPAGLPTQDAHRGWGLITMSERAEAVGGCCHVESQIQQGTQIIVEVAL